MPSARVRASQRSNQCMPTTRACSCGGCPRRRRSYCATSLDGRTKVLPFPDVDPRRTSYATPCLLLLCVLACRPQAEPELVLTHVAIIDVADGTIRRDMSVVISGGQIRTVAPSSTLRLPAGAQVEDGAGTFVIPGLWDMHVHTGDPSYFARFVANGVTGVRDMGGAAESATDGCESIRPDSLMAWRHRIEAGLWVGPRVVVSGPPASGTGWPTSLPVRTPNQAIAAVDSLRALGVDFIKVYEDIPLDAYLQLASSARSAGIPFAGHVPVTTVSLLQAIGAGQRSIEHIRAPLLLCFTDDPRQLARFYAEDGWTRDDIAWGDGVHRQCPRVIDALRSSDVWLTPTLVVAHAQITDTQNHAARARWRSNMPRSVQEAFAAFVKTEGARSAAERASELLWWQTQQRLVARMHSEGVRLLAGTDVACEGGLPGVDLHTELLMLVESGLSPLAALQAATTAPAAYFGAAASMGSIAAGAVADLVLLNGNPLEDISQTQRIHGVVLRGKWLSRRVLDSALTTAVGEGR